MEREEEQEARAQGRCQGNQAGPGFSPLKREGRLPGGLFAVLKRYLFAETHEKHSQDAVAGVPAGKLEPGPRFTRKEEPRERREMGPTWESVQPPARRGQDDSGASAGTLPAELQAQPWRKEMARSRKAGSPPVWANASGTLRRKQPLPRHCMRQAEYSN